MSTPGTWSLILPTVLLALAGCTLAPADGTPSLPADQQWTTRQAILLGLGDWSARGKLAVNTPKRRRGLNFSLRRRGGDLELTLSGPLGSNATRFLYRNNQLQVTGRPDLGDPTATLAEHLGNPPPLAAIRRWILGLPSARAAVAPDLIIELDSAGRATRLREHHWELEYRRYREQRPVALPTDIVLTGPEEARLRIKVTRWQLL